MSRSSGLAVVQHFLNRKSIRVMAVTPFEQDFLDQVAHARGLEEIFLACERFAESNSAAPGVDPGRPQAALGDALHAQLSKVSTHPAFQRWVDSYFGRRPERFSSRLQQPSYIYYPTLVPAPWFDVAQVPQLASLRERVPAVRAELLEMLDAQSGFCPYVESTAARDPRWRQLAGSEAWSAIHLLRGGTWNPRVTSALAATREFLAAAPLAYCPPHAPECFISRLRPGVVLPAHFGVSNIKLTVHLPIDLPPSGCSITVGGIPKSWTPDDFLIFDDSFLHSAANHSGRDRTVLIFDVWHPSLSEDERRAMAYSIAVLDRTQSVWNGTRA